MVKVIECPRDAMQGLEHFIPTEKKVQYINQLLRVGFDTLDFGSFVSPKAIPQMRDTQEVFSRLDRYYSKTKLLAIVANLRGGEEACALSGIDAIGFPMSISETFQQRNTNKSITEALNTLQELQNLAQKHSKTLVTYISMGFGNPYGDRYHQEMVVQFAEVLKSIGVRVVSLADTVGSATPEQISSLFEQVSSAMPDLEVGVHLHSHPAQAEAKVQAALASGCTRIDGALLGFGGCPMANDALVGNIDTRTIVHVMEQAGITLDLNKEEFDNAVVLANRVFRSVD